jgi:hypothetical protein
MCPEQECGTGSTVSNVEFTSRLPGKLPKDVAPTHRAFCDKGIDHIGPYGFVHNNTAGNKVPYPPARRTRNERGQQGSKQNESDEKVEWKEKDANQSSRSQAEQTVVECR